MRLTQEQKAMWREERLSKIEARRIGIAKVCAVNNLKLGTCGRMPMVKVEYQGVKATYQLGSGLLLFGQRSIENLEPAQVVSAMLNEWAQRDRLRTQEITAA